MSTPSNKFFNRYEFDEDVRDERDRLRAVNGQLLAALEALLTRVDAYRAQSSVLWTEQREARAAIAETQKATGTQL